MIVVAIVSVTLGLLASIVDDRPNTFRGFLADVLVVSAAVLLVAR